MTSHQTSKYETLNQCCVNRGPASPTWPDRQHNVSSDKGTNIQSPGGRAEKFKISFQSKYFSKFSFQSKYLFQSECARKKLHLPPPPPWRLNGAPLNSSACNLTSHITRVDVQSDEATFPTGNSKARLFGVFISILDLVTRKKLNNLFKF